MVKRSKKRYIVICPMCNSTDVGCDFSNPALVSTGLFNNAKVCNNCGYSSNVFPEVKTDELPPVKQVKEEEKRDLVNTTYGKNINWLWRYVGPIGIVISLTCLFFYNTRLVFYLGLIGLLPISCVKTLASHRNEMLQKYPILRAVSIIIYFYTVLAVPIIIVYLGYLF